MRTRIMIGLVAATVAACAKQEAPKTDSAASNAKAAMPDAPGAKVG